MEFSTMDNQYNWHKREGLALLTDYYQLTMLGGYFKNHIGNKIVSFDYYFRNLPPHNGYAVSCGLEEFLYYLQNLKFSDSDIDFLKTKCHFPNDFLDHLKNFKLELSVYAMKEGTLAYPYEPVIRVEGPLYQAQLVETFLLNNMNFQTLIATKAARICQTTDDEPVAEFGLRRAQGPDGGLSGSRAAFIGGCTGTSNVLAGKLYDIPVIGTQAHSWIMSFPDEISAFRAYADVYPDNCTLLVDTYDTINSGVPNAIQVFKELKAKGKNVRASIRLDSGDLAKLSKQAYDMLVKEGFTNPQIVASNELDEDIIADLKRQYAKINSWGVGTNLITSKDYPALGGVYKLASVKEGENWQPKMKISSNVEKMTDPCRKEPVRYYDKENRPLGDIIHLIDENINNSQTINCTDRRFFFKKYTLQNVERHEKLLVPVLISGKINYDFPSIRDIQTYVREQLNSLPEEYRRLKNPEFFTVGLSNKLAAVKKGFLEKNNIKS